MKSKRRPELGAVPEAQGPPQEVVDRLAGLLPEGRWKTLSRACAPRTGLDDKVLGLYAGG